MLGESKVRYQIGFVFPSLKSFSFYIFKIELVTRYLQYLKGNANKMVYFECRHGSHNYLNFSFKSDIQIFYLLSTMLEVAKMD